MENGVAIKLNGPLQAWGGSIVGDDRPTLDFPTKSGVLGLIAASLGIQRNNNEKLVELAKGTKVHIRVDKPGQKMLDYQTIQGHAAASSTRSTIVSKRTYLCDAEFTAILIPGNLDLVAPIALALKYPKFLPFLGRKCCTPSEKILMKTLEVSEDPVASFQDLKATTSPKEYIDFYLDLPYYEKGLRKLPVRDDLCGPLKRQWAERFLIHYKQKIEE